MAFAPMHHNAWELLSSNARLVNLLMFRGSGKTSHCRLYTSKTIAYQLAHTIVYVGKSEGHAIRSTNWIKKQVETNSLWTETFGIRAGSKWQDTEFEILVGESNQPVWIMAVGIGGSIRGINRDDFRPDLIVLDDVLDDENAHTPEQRQKVEDLVYGALLQSLAPASEAPHAKMIGLNTPQNKEDFAVKALRDPSWVSAVYGCWTKKTATMPTDYQESAWPERFSSEDLRKEKHSYAVRNMLATFLREMECKLSSPETSSFKLPWLKKYNMPPDRPTCVYAIDPVPPPSAAAIEKGLDRRDFEAHCIWGAVGKKRYLIDYALMRGHEPTWTIAKFFEFQRKYQPIATVVEAVAYQQTLIWLLKQAMDAARQWYAITEFKDNRSRSKYLRIINAHNGLASAGLLYVKESDTDFVEQFATYPRVSHDDLLDASSMALMHLSGLYVEQDGSLVHVADDSSRWKPLRIEAAP